MNQEEKTEKATPQKLKKAREQGLVVQSREITSTFVLFVGILALFAVKEDIVFNWGGLWAGICRAIAHVHEWENGLWSFAFNKIMAFYVTLVPFLFLVVVVGILASWGQFGPIAAFERVVPDLGKMNPAQALERLFSLNTVFDMLKTALKLCGVFAIAYRDIGVFLQKAPFLMDQGPGTIYLSAGKTCLWMTIHVVVFLSVVGVLDYLYQRYRMSKELMMSKQELKEETREIEGNPLVKSRMRHIMKRITLQRMMMNVSQADVVIRAEVQTLKPGHRMQRAVALKYSYTKNAPEVVGKGSDLMVQKMVQIAEKNKVKIVENNTLAQNLYTQVNVGQEVPGELYQSIAEMAYFKEMNRGEKE